jgi:hypothetical protein
MSPLKEIEPLSETDFAYVLISLWHESGRNAYKPWIVKRIGPDGNQIPEASPSPNKQSQ